MTSFNFKAVKFFAATMVLILELLIFILSLAESVLFLKRFVFIAVIVYSDSISFSLKAEDEDSLVFNTKLINESFPFLCGLNVVDQLNDWFFTVLYYRQKTNRGF